MNVAGDERQLAADHHVADARGGRHLARVPVGGAFMVEWCPADLRLQPVPHADMDQRVACQQAGRPESARIVQRRVARTRGAWAAARTGARRSG